MTAFTSFCMLLTKSTTESSSITALTFFNAYVGSGVHALRCDRLLQYLEIHHLEAVWAETRCAQLG